MFGTRKSTQLIRFLQIFFRIFKKKYKPPKTGPEMSIKTARDLGAGLRRRLFGSVRELQLPRLVLPDFGA